MKRGLACGLIGFLLSSGAVRGDETITFFENAFLPTAVNIDVGETVHFVRSEGCHTVTSGVSSDPADRPGELFDATIDEENPTFSFTFTTSGPVSFFCREHETGLVGNIIIEPVTVVIGVVNNSFTPAEVAIFAGDRVRWNWIEGFHTVTSGLSSNPEDDPGALFDESITAAQPVVTHVFTTPGLEPYFCRPHEPMDMKGTVRVQRLFIRGDVNDDLAIGLLDGLDLLGHLFLNAPPPSCLDAADANDNGALELIDALDILNYLFLNGPALPAPFPVAGADRSDDALLCE